MAARSTPLYVVGARQDGGAPPEGAAPAGTARRALRIAGPLAALVAFALVLLHGTSEARALRRLPAAERAALYQRTLDTVRTTCAADARRELHDLCRSQAELLLLFPECDGACAAVAREQLRTPTR